MKFRVDLVLVLCWGEHSPDTPRELHPERRLVLGGRRAFGAAVLQCKQKRVLVDPGAAGLLGRLATVPLGDLGQG